MRRRLSGIRYERPRPGDLLHIDVKKLGRVPDGGGWRLNGRKEEVWGRGNDYDFLHVAVDDHSRVAYLLTDNAKVYRIGSNWRAVCVGLGIWRRFTKPGYPWTNGKAERLNRTLLTEFAYARPWLSNTDRLTALDGWVRRYNTRRAHSALGGHPPITRLAA